MVRIALALGAVALLLSAGIEDARTRLIADRKSAGLVVLAPFWWIAGGATLWPGVPVQVALAIATFAVFAAAFHVGAMGGGDVKLIAALSLWLPPMLLMWMLVVMSLAGGAVTLAMLVERLCRRDAAPVEVPYGVAIAIAGILTITRTHP